MNLTKKLTENAIQEYEIKNSMFKIYIIGESHEGIKKKGLSKKIIKNKYEIIIVEAPKSYMNETMKELKTGYNKTIKKNKKLQKDSYMDMVIYYFIDKYYKFLNRNKKLKEINKEKKIKLECLDDRTEKDYPNDYIRKMYKTKENKNKVLKLIKKTDEIKNKIEKMEESKIKNNLLKMVNKNLKLLNKKSDWSFRSCSEIILDYNIIKFILLKKNKDKKIIIVCGNKHLNNLKKILD